MRVGGRWKHRSFGCPGGPTQLDRDDLLARGMTNQPLGEGSGRFVSEGVVLVGRFFFHVFWFQRLLLWLRRFVSEMSAFFPVGIKLRQVDALEVQARIAEELRPGVCFALLA